ncbi:hypothetical protein A2U01_0114597, partial [Trifolium medium]|nr:hypothetical protein [Trifolium medium]
MDGGGVDSSNEWEWMSDPDTNYS